MSSTVVVMQSPNDLEVRSPAKFGSRSTETIVFTNCSNGLGIKIIGGLSDEDDKDYGIFVKKVLIGGLAESDGRLQDGDQILEVNGESLEHVSNERAVTVLRNGSASNRVIMVVTHDEKSQLDFMELMESQGSYSYYSGSESGSMSSRLSTPFDKQSWGVDDDRMTPMSSQSMSPMSSGGAQMLAQDSGTSNSQEYDHAASPPVLSGRNSGIVLPKVPNSAAHTQQRGLLIHPAFASTPQTNQSGSNNQHITPQTRVGDPSPVNRQAINVQSPPTPTNESGYSRSQHKSRNMSQSRKLSLDPHVRLKVEKLEVALKYLGIVPTAEQQYELRRRLPVDETGHVNYGEFVRTSRDIFRFQLEERNISNSTMYFAANDITDFAEPPAFRPELSSIPDVAVPTQNVKVPADYEQIKEERDKLQKEVTRLKSLLKEKEQSCKIAEEELLRIRKEAQGAITESRSLRSKVHLAEQAQHAARNMEQDYEEVITLLETEIAELKSQQEKELENPLVQKRLAVLACQLRKAEVSKKTYEVSTEKLLQFAEVVHATVTGQKDSIHRSDTTRGESSRGNKPPGYLGKHKKLSPQDLGSEARDVVKAVKSLIEVEPLPFGWDEAYTEDGMKYYTNHVTQQTQWVHPVSNVQHLAPSREGREVLT